MTGFKFLHAADLHLGSPFHGLALRDETVAKRIAEASRGAFTDLVTRAIEEGVSFAVIAGDVYDGDWRDNSIGLFFNRELARLERAGIEVFLLKGNHDAESVVTRSVSLPVSVKHFATDAPTTFRIEHLQVALHGQGFAQRAVTTNLTLNYPPRVSGWFNIGVLHTALTGHPPHDNYAPASAGHLRARGYDYWALGHVHDFEVIQTKPHIVYPGNLQGRNIRETGEKGAVLVSVLDGEVTSLERLIVDRARWADVTVDVAGATSEAAVLRAVEERLQPIALIATERLVAVRITLRGETEIHRSLVAHSEQMTDEVTAACHRVHSDIWLERLDIRTSTPPVRRDRRDALAALDLAALLDDIDGDAELQGKVRQFLGDVRVRMPGTIAPADQDLISQMPQLMEEARELLLTRAADEA